MSLESAISDLITSTNTLNTNVQNTLSSVNTQINSLKDNFLDASAALYVGPGKQFTDIQSAIDYANVRFPKNFIVRIALSPGVYTLTKYINISTNLKMIISGSSTNPENYVINGAGVGGISITSGDVTLYGITIDLGGSGTCISTTNCTLNIRDGVVLSNATTGILADRLSKLYFTSDQSRPSKYMDLTVNNITGHIFQIFTNSSCTFYSNTNIIINNSSFDRLFYLYNNSSITTGYQLPITFNNSSGNYFIECNTLSRVYGAGRLTNASFKIRFILLQNNSSLYWNFYDPGVSLIDMNNTNSECLNANTNSSAIINNIGFKNANRGLYAAANSIISTSNVVSNLTNITTSTNPPLNTSGNGNSYIIG